MSNEPVAPEDTLYLIDGHAQIFRAYHAIRGGMSSPVTGEATHAVFGFAGMLLKLITTFRPESVVMAIDMPGKTFRDELYSGYKAQRDPPPEDFYHQEQRIYEMTRLFKIPIVGVAGAEADDVIATLVQRVLDDPDQLNTNIRIVSRDKDLEQLIGPRVSLFDIHKDQTIDQNRLESEKGIRPDQIVDMLALMGDTADNIKGVEGIGPKTAAKLICEYGSIEGILKNIDKIKGKRRDNIEASQDRLSLNRSLVELKRDLTINIDLNNAKTTQINGPGLRKLFQTLGFRRHLRDLDEWLRSRNIRTDKSSEVRQSLFGPLEEDAGIDDGISKPSEQTHYDGYSTADDCDYHAITTIDQLRDLVTTLKVQPIISIDTETIGLGRKVELCGLSFSWKSGTGAYVPILSPDPDQHLDRVTVLETIRKILEDQNLPKCGHNLKYDMLVLQHAGIPLRGIAFDSMIASQLLGYPSRGLDQLAETVLNHRMIPISDLIGPRGDEQATIDQIELAQVTPYAAEDTDIALRLYEKLDPELKDQDMEQLAAVEMPLVEVLSDMEYNGIRVDPAVLLEQKTQLTQKIDQLRGRIHAAAGTEFNLDSPKQLADVLFNKLGLPIGKRGKTGPSTDVEVLERLAGREDLPSEHLVVPQLIVEYRQFSKMVNTYLDNLRNSIDESDKRVHASFRQLGAATGRLSSGGPNLQNIPVRTDLGRQIRKAFVADSGHQLICADYSQVELRILAHLSEDPALTEAFNQDHDVHAAVASEVFNVSQDQVSIEQRNAAKVVNFGIIYGVTPYGLARRIEGLDTEGAKQLISDYRRRFAGIDRFMQKCVQEALEWGYVRTMLGRRRPIPQIQSGSAATRALGERLAINTVVQGSATADLIKTAMVNLYRRIHLEKLPLKILVQIHDELLLEAPNQNAEYCAKIVQKEMEQAMRLNVPLKVDIGIGRDWHSAK